MTLDAFNESCKIWNTITKDENLINSKFDLNLHKQMLDVFQVGSYYYFILNVRKSMFEVVSPEIENVLGYAPQEVTLPFFFDCMHPEDRPYYLNFETAIGDFFNNISGECIFKYKVQYDFRVRKADGSYVRILNQFIILQHDAEDVRTFVINTDITHLKKESAPFLSFIGMDGEPSYLNVDVKDVFKPTHQIFTKREREILKALAYGMNSSEISETLSISKHTVDSHRKNMLKKTEAKSTNEIIRIAFDNGWV